MRFTFVVPFRNCAGFLKRCADSLLEQTHEDWVAFFRDDFSDDNGVDSIPHDPRILIQRRSERGGGLANIHEGLMTNVIGMDDIVCLMNGDDYLVGPSALDAVEELYDRTGCLVSYGQYENDDGTFGHCRAYRKDEFERLRTQGFLASHLRTFRYRVYAEAMRQDPSCERYIYRDGKFFDMAWDIALMTPLLEIAGFDRVAFNPRVVYHYTRHSGNEHMVDSSRQQDCARVALLKKPMSRAHF